MCGRAHLCIPLGDTAVLVAGNDVSAEGAESGNGDLGQLIDDNAQGVFAGLLGLGIWVDVVDVDCAELALALLRD